MEFCLWWQFPNAIPCHLGPRLIFCPRRIRIPFATQCWAQYSQPDHQLLRSVASPAVRWAYGPASWEPSNAWRRQELSSWPLFGIISASLPMNPTQRPEWLKVVLQISPNYSCLRLTIDNPIRNIMEHPRTWIEALNALFQLRSEKRSKRATQMLQSVWKEKSLEKYRASQQVSASPPHSRQLPRRHCTAQPDWHGSLTGYGQRTAFVIQTAPSITTTTITKDQGPRTRTRKVRQRIRCPRQMDLDVTTPWEREENRLWLLDQDFDLSPRCDEYRPLNTLPVAGVRCDNLRVGDTANACSASHHSSITIPLWRRPHLSEGLAC